MSMSRRSFLESSAAGALVLATADGRAAASEGSPAYRDAVARTWQAPRSAARDGLDHRELVRLATLAASSHNTQPWRFRLGSDGMTILPDFSRRCPVVDPDDAHVFKSLGCAAENLVHAAAAQGYTTDLRFDPDVAGVVASFVRSATARPGELYGAIARRQCTRSDYDGRHVPAGELKSLEDAGRSAGVRIVLLADPVRLESIVEYVAEGNRRQLGDPGFVEELVRWIRFSDAEALRSGDGLFSRASGNPAVPRWVGRAVLPFVLTAGRQNEKDARGIRSSAGVAAFVATSDDRAAWIETGRVYERFALQTTALGIRHAFINQPIEVRALRPQLETLLGLDGERAMLLVRFGYGPEMPRSLRRPPEAVIA